MCPSFLHLLVQYHPQIFRLLFMLLCVILPLCMKLLFCLWMDSAVVAELILPFPPVSSVFYFSQSAAELYGAEMGSFAFGQTEEEVSKDCSRFSPLERAEMKADVTSCSSILQPV